MDDDEGHRVTHRRAILLIAALAVLIGIFAWQQQREQERRREEQIAQAEGIARVLNATFSEQSKLKVGEVKGALDVTSVDPGDFQILRSSQRVTLPYSVDYTLNLSGMDLGDFRWDAQSRTLVVEAPDIQPGRPNIDESRRVLQETEGLWVSRRASENLSRRAAGLANQAAAKEARKPEQMQKARENARRALARLIETPLEAANLGDVNVIVRFPADGVRNTERWDASPPISEVLQRNRKAQEAQ